MKHALVPVIFIMFGTAMLGTGWYLGKPARIVQYEQYGSLTLTEFWIGEPTFVVSNSYTGSVPVRVFKYGYIWSYRDNSYVCTNEIRPVLLFTVPRPENMKFFDIENVVIKLNDYVAANLYIGPGDTWYDFAMDIGKLKYPENYLNIGDDPVKIDRLKDFDMDLIVQYDTAKQRVFFTGSPPTPGIAKYLYGSSYKIKYNGENLIGIGFVMLPTTGVPRTAPQEFIAYVSIQIEGKGLVKLYGYVTDENGMPLSGVCVSCNYGVVYTDENGYYQINVPEGTVELRYSKNGYYVLKKTVRVPDIESLRVVDVTLEKIPENVSPPPPSPPPPSPPSLTLDKVLRICGLAFIVIGVLSLVGMSIVSRREKGMYWRC
jgi:hypothetical protein